MKWALSLAAIYCAYAIWKIKPSAIALSLLLGFVALIHASGRFEREQWALFNWLAVATFVFTAIFMGKAALSSTK
jgi:hypothetical protein